MQHPAPEGRSSLPRSSVPKPPSPQGNPGNAVSSSRSWRRPRPEAGSTRCGSPRRVPGAALHELPVEKDGLPAPSSVEIPDMGVAMDHGPGMDLLGDSAASGDRRRRVAARRVPRPAPLRRWDRRNCGRISGRPRPSKGLREPGVQPGSARAGVPASQVAPCRRASCSRLSATCSALKVVSAGRGRPRRPPRRPR